MANEKRKLFLNYSQELYICRSPVSEGKQLESLQPLHGVHIDIIRNFLI
jgi:hypothetical protein